VNRGDPEIGIRVFAIAIAGNPDAKIVENLEAEADARQVRVLLQNLLGNAWKFTGKSEHGQIEMGVIPAENGPASFVRENGVGFDMAYAGKLFGAFQRLHDTDEFPINKPFTKQLLVAKVRDVLREPVPNAIVPS
jgi:signal transduction histidine kinase